MSVAARRIRAGDVILASGSLLLLVAILAHVAAAPAAPPPGRTEVRSDLVSEGAPVGPATSGATTDAGAVAPLPSVESGDEPPPFIPNSRTIQSWKDLPVHVIHRPHWVSGRSHPKGSKGDGIDAKLRNAELHLELMGFDSDSIRYAFDLVNRVDAAVGEPREGVDPAARLLELARGGKEASDLALAIGEGANEEAVRVRALAILAAHGGAAGVSEELLALAMSDPSGTIRTAAGVSLLWMGREAEVARWVSSEASSKAVSEFFDSVQAGVNKLEERRLPKTLVFSHARAVESSTLVEVLMEGTAPARWDSSARAKIYSIAALYGGDRPEVAAWMEREYVRAPDNLTRASILFASPGVAGFGGLEDRAIEVARAGGSGYLVRTALFSLGQYRTERSMRVLMEVTPKAGEDTALHAIRALERLQPWFGREIEPFLRTLAAGHPDAALREAASAALARSFTRTSR